MGACAEAGLGGFGDQGTMGKLRDLGRCLITSSWDLGAAWGGREFVAAAEPGLSHVQPGIP